MKALRKEELIKAIEVNFADNQLIMEDSITLNDIWYELGHDWNIEDNRWIETKYNEVWAKDYFEMEE